MPSRPFTTVLDPELAVPGSRYIESTLFQIYYFSNFNVLKTAIGVFEGAESNEINFI